MLIPQYIKKNLLPHPGSEEQLSCCLDLCEQGLSELDRSSLELDVPDCLYHRLPSNNVYV